MADMRKEFPAQEKNRKQWIIDTVRANQRDVSSLLSWVASGDYIAAKSILKTFHKMDRDALLQSDGIFTLNQLNRLNE